MYIKKTTILPENDFGLADAIFDAYLHEHRKTLFVVVGDDEATRRLVEKADRWAGLLEEPRWVLWVRNKSYMERLALDLHDPNHLIATWSGVMAFTVSINDNICEVLPYSAEDIRTTRIIRAYAKAEADNLKAPADAIVARGGAIRSRGLEMPPAVDTAINNTTPPPTPVKLTSKTTAKTKKTKAKAKPKTSKVKTVRGNNKIIIESAPDDLVHDDGSVG